MLAACAAAGVMHFRQQATCLQTDGGRASGATMADGSVISADKVVLSAGWESAALDGLPPGVAPPLRPVKGQIIRLRPGAGERGGKRLSVSS